MKLSLGAAKSDGGVPTRQFEKADQPTVEELLIKILDEQRETNRLLARLDVDGVPLSPRESR